MLRHKWSLLRAVSSTAGTRTALGWLAEHGWCEFEENADVFQVTWVPEAWPFLKLCGRRGDEEDLADRCQHLVRLVLFLDLLAAAAPPTLAAALVQCDPGTAWGSLVVSQIGRGRYLPAWQGMGRAWHDALRNGRLPVPVLLPGFIEESLWLTVQRLAEFGWVSYAACDTPTCTRYVLRWPDEVTRVLALIGGSGRFLRMDPRLLAAGRLSLLLHLELMRVPGELWAQILAGGGMTDAWACGLAHRVTRGQVPLWWDRRPSWHAAVRERLLSQVPGEGRKDARL